MVNKNDIGNGDSEDDEKFFECHDNEEYFNNQNQIGKLRTRVGTENEDTTFEEIK